MEKLKKTIDSLLAGAGVDKKDILAPDRKKPVFPFSETGKILAYLLWTGKITYEEYLQISNDYQERNKYLELFELSPRTFGETWGEQHIRTLFPQFLKETKERNPEFDGEYDLILDDIHIEVKACRANSTKTKGNLAGRAYSHMQARKSGFKYHFQQLKPSCCDVFIWIGVCKDQLLYWVLTSEELLQTGKLKPQHRNENTGVKGTGVYEGQVFMKEEELQSFRVQEEDILETVHNKKFDVYK